MSINWHLIHGLPIMKLPQRVNYSHVKKHCIGSWKKNESNKNNIVPKYATFTNQATNFFSRRKLASNGLSTIASIKQNSEIWASIHVKISHSHKSSKGYIFSLWRFKKCINIIKINLEGPSYQTLKFIKSHRA